MKAMIKVDNDRYVVYVESKFLDRIGECRDFYTLIHTYRIRDYLHNDSGPAILDTETGNVQYFIHGEPASEKDIHNMLFTNRANDLLEL